MSDETHTATELAKKHGQHQGALVSGDDPFTANHNIAVVLNGWAHHERSTGEVVLLTDAEYLAAIECAKSGKPHPPVNKRAQAEATAPETPRAQAEATPALEAPKKKKHERSEGQEG